jgi:hypothetical protein
VAEEKQGTVYITAVPSEVLAGEWEEFQYIGHWESSEPHRLLENGPGWDDPEEAVGWARERARLVFVRIRDETFSAGEDDPEDEVVLRWKSG